MMGRGVAADSGRITFNQPGSYGTTGDCAVLTIEGTEIDAIRG